MSRFSPVETLIKSYFGQSGVITFAAADQLPSFGLSRPRSVAVVGRRQRCHMQKTQNRPRLVSLG